MFLCVNTYSQGRDVAPWHSSSCPHGFRVVSSFEICARTRELAGPEPLHELVKDRQSGQRLAILSKVSV